MLRRGGADCRRTKAPAGRGRPAGAVCGGVRRAVASRRKAPSLIWRFPPRLQPGRETQVNRFFGSFSRQQALARLTANERQWAEPGHGLCAIELKSSGKFIGRSGLQYWEQFDEVELEWTLRADHWGHGFATEAARACLDWGFATLDDDYFTALMRPGNDASVRWPRAWGSRRAERTICWAAPSRNMPWTARPICALVESLEHLESHVAFGEAPCRHAG
ncbi:GNAT family N-acetyltransferase [Streptomyces canus]|uniref:GNAT family N-acetyltransferase n=1 Tax=Streptomyces canus TaxID=58343 RepID=UPI003712B5E3